MKITKRQLRRIIREEKARLLTERNIRVFVRRTLLESAGLYDHPYDQSVMTYYDRYESKSDTAQYIYEQLQELLGDNHPLTSTVEEMIKGSDPDPTDILDEIANSISGGEAPANLKDRLHSLNDFEIEQDVESGESKARKEPGLDPRTGTYSKDYVPEGVLVAKNEKLANAMAAEMEDLTTYMMQNRMKKGKMDKAWKRAKAGRATLDDIDSFGGRLGPYEAVLGLELQKLVEKYSGLSKNDLDYAWQEALDMIYPYISSGYGPKGDWKTRYGNFYLKRDYEPGYVSHGVPAYEDMLDDDDPRVADKKTFGPKRIDSGSITDRLNKTYNTTFE